MKYSSDVEKHLIPKDKQLSFMLAGNSQFTIENTKTDNRFSFKIKKSKKDMYFVSVDTKLHTRKEQETHRQFNYLGVIFVDSKKYFHGKKSKFSYSSQYNKVFEWLFNAIKTNRMPDYVDFFHNNHCARCGKTLRVPESIISGYGPECIKNII